MGKALIEMQKQNEAGHDDDSATNTKTAGDQSSNETYRDG